MLDEKIEINETAVRKSAKQETAFSNMLNDEMENLILGLGYRKESDTAKEVLNKIRSLFPTAERCDFGDLYLIDKIEKIAEEYGVEVDEI